MRANFYTPFGLIAAALFVASVVVHASTFVGLNLAGRFRPVYALHVGIFVLLIPVVLKQKHEEKRENDRLTTLLTPPTTEQSRRPASPLDIANVPGWVTAGYLALVAYAAINFLLFITTVPYNPEMRDGKYVLSDHGRIVREITREEYEYAEAKVLRGFSGHWMIFYFYIASVGLYGTRGRDESANQAMNYKSLP